MAEKTNITWCDHTTGFWSGCTQVSPGCDHCYAMARDRRFFAGVHWGPGAPRKERLLAAAKDLQRWNRKAKRDGVRRAVFINSLADFFDNEVPQPWRDFAYEVFAGCDALDIILLTKRVSNVLAMVPEEWLAGFPANIRLGITVVHQLEADRDIPKLERIPACVRFLSCEPLLAPLDLTPWLRWLDWVIVGGESGRGARPFDLAWARSIQAQCRVARTPFFMKQLGAYPIDNALASSFTIRRRHPGAQQIHMTKHIAGAEPTEWPADLQVQEFPSC